MFRNIKLIDNKYYNCLNDDIPYSCNGYGMEFYNKNDRNIVHTNSNIIGGNDGSIINCCGGGGSCGYIHCPLIDKGVNGCIPINQYSDNKCFPQINGAPCPNNWINSNSKGWLP